MIGAFGANLQRLISGGSVWLTLYIGKGLHVEGHWNELKRAQRPQISPDNSHYTKGQSPEPGTYEIVLILNWLRCLDEECDRVHI